MEDGDSNTPQEAIISSTLVASINKTCLKANVDSSLITNTIQKRGEKIGFSKTLSRLENLSVFSNKGYSVGDSSSQDVNCSSKKLKLIEEYRSFTAIKSPEDCSECKQLFYDQVPPCKTYRFQAYSHFAPSNPKYKHILGGHKIAWTTEKVVGHWIGHKDTEIAQIFSKDGISGIFNLDDKRIANFFRHLKLFYSR